MDQKQVRQYQQKYKEYLSNDIIPFWLEHGMDKQNGGLYTCLDRQGKLYNTDKSVWFQGRFAWIMAKLCNTYGVKEEWREACYSCLIFLEDHCVDSDGRMYFSVTEDGSPLRKRRYFFSECFYTIALAEASKAFCDADLYQKADRMMDFLMKIYDDPDSDPYKITPKVISSTRQSRAFANPMILLNTAHILKDCNPSDSMKYSQLAKRLTEDIFSYYYKEEYGIFLESVGMNGEIQMNITGGRTVNPGHTIEGVWFLIEQAIQTGDTSLLHKAEHIFNCAIEYGWDEDYAGIYAFGDVTGAPPEALEHDMKLWWPMCELIISALLLFEQTGDEKYWQWFTKADDYVFTHFADQQYGEWYGYLHRDGTPTEPAAKGNLFKGPFHIPRMLILAEQILGEIADKLE